MNMRIDVLRACPDNWRMTALNSAILRVNLQLQVEAFEIDYQC